MPKQAKDQKKTENKNKSVEKKDKKVKNQSPAKSPEKNAQKNKSSSKSPVPAKDGKKAVAKPKEESKRRSLSKDEKPKKRSKSSMSPNSKEKRKIAKDKKKMKKAEKDPAKPKGPIRAYFQYTGPGMVELRKKGGECINTDGSFKINPQTKEPWKHTELMALLAARWGALSEDGRAPYRKLEEKELARHKREMEEYSEKGYFTRADGTKSNEGIEPREHPVSDSEAKPVQKKQSKARAAKNKKKEEKKTAELSDEDS